MKRARSAVPLAVVAAICLCANTNVTAQAPEPLTASLSHPDRPRTLRVQLVNGSINVRGMTRADVSIGVRTGAEGRGITVTEENNQILVSVNGARQRVDLELVVPTRTNLRLSIVSDGGIVVDNVIGELEVNSTNGPITATNIEGAIVARTVSGDVRAAITRVSAGMPMSFTAFNGAVDVTLPSSLRANLKLRTDQGDVFTDYKLQMRPATPTPVDEPQRTGRR